MLIIAMQHTVVAAFNSFFMSFFLFFGFEVCCSLGSVADLRGPIPHCSYVHLSGHIAQDRTS